MKYIQIITIVAALVAASCTNRNRNTEKEIDYESLTAEEMLAVMRSDTSWTRELDSMAQVAIGPGAKCIDPVWHLFSYDGRFWLFNQDWKSRKATYRKTITPRLTCLSTAQVQIPLILLYAYPSMKVSRAYRMMSLSRILSTVF